MEVIRAQYALATYPRLLKDVFPVTRLPRDEGSRLAALVMIARIVAVRLTQVDQCQVMNPLFAQLREVKFLKNSLIFSSCVSHAHAIALKSVNIYFFNLSLSLSPKYLFRCLDVFSQATHTPVICSGGVPEAQSTFACEDDV